MRRGRQVRHAPVSECDLIAIAGEVQLNQLGPRDARARKEPFEDRAFGGHFEDVGCFAEVCIAREGCELLEPHVRALGDERQIGVDVRAEPVRVVLGCCHTWVRGYASGCAEGSVILTMMLARTCSG